MLDEVIAAIAAHEARPTLVGLTGPVSVGKTTMSRRLADALKYGQGLDVAIVSTDGFLFPQAELIERDLAMRKGFPESYDTERLTAFLADARRGGELRVPLYDHLTYDVGETVTVEIRDVLILEGVNALGPEYAGAYDVTLYIDADDDAVFEWFCARMLSLFEEARDDPRSFYAAFATMPEGEVREFARSAWDGINAVNLEEHIRPARARAQFVIEKAPDHSIRRVTAAR